MKCFGRIYRYECVKLLQKKMVWVATAAFLGVVVAVVLSGLLGNVFVNTNSYCSKYELMAADRDFERALTDRRVDQALLEEMKAAYLEYERASEAAGEHPTDEEGAALADLHMEVNRPYKAIYDLAKKVMDMTGDEVLDWAADEEDFYARRRSVLEASWEQNRLSQEEQDYWQAQESRLAFPFTYQYKTGYAMLISALYSVSVFAMLLIALCLSGSFSEEHALRTDQLVLATGQGRRTLYLAKLLAGITYSVGMALVSTLVMFALFLGVYGPEGFDAPLQLLRPDYSYPMTVGQFTLLSYGMLVLVSAVVSVFVMVLSEGLRSGVATLGGSVVLVLLGMFLNIPEEYRVLSQLWDALPVNLLFAGNLYDVRLISLFGQQFTVWQAAPVLYLLAAAGAGALGWRLYRGYQVTGR